MKSVFKGLFGFFSEMSTHFPVLRPSFRVGLSQFAYFRFIPGCLIIFMGIAVTFLSASDIAVLTIASGDAYREQVALGTQSKREYCQKQGYDFIYIEETLDPSRHPAWSKILLTLNALESNSYRWVVWIDADTLIMNYEIRLEEIIDDRYHFMITADPLNGICSGVYFIKNCEWSIQFLKNAYERTGLPDEWRFYEQPALIQELIDQNAIGVEAKICPQRDFNAYNRYEHSFDSTMTYQKGDFLIHFAGSWWKTGGNLKPLFEKHYWPADKEHPLDSLDHYLRSHGYHLFARHSSNNEGYILESQKKQFQKELEKKPGIERILEVGLNGGHSAECFFLNCENLKHFVSFDINQHDYTPVAVSYFEQKYKSRFHFIEGDSSKTIPSYAKSHPNTFFDLIYIDGNHTYEGAMQDIVNCRSLAHRNTLLWVDDYNCYEVKSAVHFLQDRGIIKIEKVHGSRDENGKRCWIEAKYL